MGYACVCQCVISLFQGFFNLLLIFYGEGWLGNWVALLGVSFFLWWEGFFKEEDFAISL